MSHQVNLKGVKFTDLNLLEQAVSELANECGGALQFVREKTTIRGWNGAPHVVDCAIKCTAPDDQYDVGFNYDAEAKAYVPYLESMFHSASLGVSPGAKTIEGAACSTRGSNTMLARLQQRYQVVTVERNAARGGMKTRRMPAQHGQIQLEVTQ